MNSIKDRQEAIIEEFSMLEENLEMVLNYIIELGEELPPFPEEARTDDNIVKGCQSKVWLDTKDEDGRMHFSADSNTAITRGLVSLLVRVLNQSTPEDVINSEIYFPMQIGMNRFIGTQRSNGFASMIDRMKMDTIALISKKNK